MRTIISERIAEAAAELCRKAANELPDDVLRAVERAGRDERSEIGAAILEQCIENARIASEDGVPICQDTGTAVYLVQLGKDVRIEGATLEDALNKGTAKGYSDNFLRKSIVADPVFGRVNTGSNTPAVIHVETVPGDALKIMLLLKGAGSENMSAVRMLKPSDGVDGIVTFVVSTVIEAGGNPCPPVIVGVGIGGNMEQCALLAKKALARETGSANADENYAALEKRILGELNASGVGPQGLGGTQTVLAVHIEHAPCHMASLPVAVNINCHAARHASAEL